MRAAVISVAIAAAFISGCSSHQDQVRQQVVKPEWITEKNVGCSMLPASGLMGDQKKLAVEHAIVNLMVQNGDISGTSKVMMDRSHEQDNTKDKYSIRFLQNGIYNVSYAKQPFEIEIINNWFDPYNGQYYVQIRKK